MKFLFLFILVVIVNLIVLLFDYALLKLNKEVITDYARAYPLLAIALIVFECLNPIFLALHFYRD